MSIRNSFFTLLSIVLLLLACATIEVIRLTPALNALNASGDLRMTSLMLVDELRASSEELTTQARVYAVTGDPQAEELYWNVVKVRAGEKARSSSLRIAPGEKCSLLDLLKANKVTPQEYALVEESYRLSSNLVLLETESMNAVKGLFKDAQGNYTVKGPANSTLAASLMFGDAYQAVVADIMKPLDTFTENVNIRVQAAYEHTFQQVENVTRVLGGLFICILLSMCVMGWYILSKVSKPLNDTAAFASRVSQGALSEQIPVLNHNEISTLRKSLNQLVVNLRQRIQDAEKKSDIAEQKQSEAQLAMAKVESAMQKNENTHKLNIELAEELETVVSSTQENIKTISNQLSNTEANAEEQAKRMFETAQAMENMHSTVQAVNSSALSAAEVTMQARDHAHSGAKMVTEMVQSMDEMQSQTLELKTGMEELSASAEGVGKIMTTISDIADQTNLLALNAAIEAARAGESGRGFAVVADEVRKLAEKTMNATRDVGTVIASIQNATAKNILEVNQTVDKIEKVTQFATKSGQVLHEIVTIVEGATAEVQTISKASSQQKDMSIHITHTIDDVTSLSQETATQMRAATQHMRDMLNQVNNVKNLTDKLRTS